MSRHNILRDDPLSDVCARFTYIANWMEHYESKFDKNLELEKKLSDIDKMISLKIEEALEKAFPYFRDMIETLDGLSREIRTLDLHYYNEKIEKLKEEANKINNTIRNHMAYHLKQIAIDIER